MDVLIDKASLDRWSLLLHNAETLFMATHTHPDGDAIGSLQALSSYLRRKGHRVYTACPNAFPDFLGFLDPQNEIMIYDREPAKIEAALLRSDLILCVDLSGFPRMNALGALLQASALKKILIDHHLDPEKETFDIVFSHTRVSSCCELTYHLLRTWENGNLNLSLAEARALYTGILTDTNSFHNSIFKQTFEVVTALMARGIDKNAIEAAVYGTFSVQRMRLMGYFLLKKMQVLPERSAAYTILTKKEMREFEYQTGDTEGFVNLPLSIKGIKISALFTEQDEYFRVSLRSTGPLPVNEIARRFFKGGGHLNASGGRFYGRAEEIEDVFIRAIDLFKIRDLSRGTIIAGNNP